MSTDGKKYSTITGKIYTEWEKLVDKIGYPTEPAGSNSSTGILWQAFENGLIVGSDKTGFFESSGKIREVWAKNGFESGRLGFPTSGIISDGKNTTYQKYEGGIIECATTCTMR